MIWVKIYKINSLKTNMRWYLVIMLAFLYLQGCAKPQIEPPAPKAESEVQSAPRLAKKIPSMEVVILVSENIPAYTQVANELAKLLDQQGTVQLLTGSQLKNIQIISQIKKKEHTQFVSIGLNAAIAAKSLSKNQLVFCQVFNYQDFALISPMHKGVSMLPSLHRTFSTWRALSPTITDIGVISGPGQSDTIKTAKIAARSFGITLHHAIVKSDKEYQYAYKKLGKKVQGYWLLPDNRVLSENTLRDIMNFSVRNSKQVAVFSQELLKLGGLLSINSDYKDIAQQVYERLQQAQTSDTVPGPDIVYLEKMNLRINSIMAHNLDIKIPEQYRKYANAP